MVNEVVNEDKKGKMVANVMVEKEKGQLRSWSEREVVVEEFLRRRRSLRSRRWRSRWCGLNENTRTGARHSIHFAAVVSRRLGHYLQINPLRVT